MTRRVETVTITAEGRDKGRTYIVTEMSAFQAEDLAVRILFALTNAGIDVPEATSGMAGLAAAGLKTLEKLPYKEAQAILAEMLPFMQYQHKPGQPPMALDETCVEDVTTLFTLRRTFIQLHLGFLKAGATQIMG